MKKTAIFLSVSLLAVQASAQEYYHDGTRITADGITFNVRKRMEIFNLSNASNHLVNENWQYLDGTEVDPEANNVDYLSARASFDLELMKKALKETFSKAEYERLSEAKKSGFRVFYAIDGQGNVLEISFILNARLNPELARIPPEKYAQLEKNIRKHIKWETNEYAKKFKFLHASSQLQFPDLPIDYDSETPGPYTKPASQKGP